MTTLTVPKLVYVSPAGGALVKNDAGTTILTLSAGDIVMVATVADQAPVQPRQQNTVGQYPQLNPNWIRSIRASDNAVSIVRNGASSVAVSMDVLVAMAVALEPSLTWTPPTILTVPANATVVADGSFATFTVSVGSEDALVAGDYAWQESADGVTYGSALTTTGIYDVSVAGTLKITPATAFLTTSDITDASNITDGKVVVLGAKTYTFKTTLTPTEGEVLLGAHSAASLLNLIRAINHTGTPDTDYKCAVANAEFSADAAVTAHKVRVSAKAAGTYSTTTDETTLSWTATTVVSKTGFYYKCTISDHASTPGAVTTVPVILTVS